MNKEKLQKELFSICLYAVIVLLLAFFLRNFVMQRTVVEGHSMENTLHDKEQLIIDKFSYLVKKPERFDIIVFPYRYDNDIYYIKRIIGLPGETVRIIGNTIYINGKPLPEDYGKEVMDENTAGIAGKEILLAEDEYFVLGDNRNHSADSRNKDVGAVKQNEIIGKAFLRIWPMEDFGILYK